MNSLVRRKLIDSPPLDLRVSRRQLLQGAGAVALAALLRPTDVFAHDDDEPLGPFGPWSEPVNLGPVVNSPFDDLHPAISKNGLSLFITSKRPGGVNGANRGQLAEIWVAQRAHRDAPWGPPENLGPVINSFTNAGSPNFSPDGHLMFFHSRPPGNCGAADLYVARRKNKRDDFGWQEPVNLGCTINSPFADNGPTYFEDEETGTVTMYFNSERPPGGIGSPHIYASILGDDGTFGPAVLVPELSSPRFDGRTAIRRDGLEMLVGSNRLGSIGAEDLWVSTRATTSGAWSTPVNLGPPINSGFDNGGVALSFDATTLYFRSDRPGGFGGLDLYVATRHRIDGEDRKDDRRDDRVHRRGER